MKYYLEHKNEVIPLLNEGENYIIFNDGKPIKEIFLNDSDIEVSMDECIELSDYAPIQRSKEADEIRSKVGFNVHITIHNDVTLKLIHLNDDADMASFSLSVDSKKQAKVLDIYLSIARESKVLTEVLLNTKSKLDYFIFSHSSAKVENYFNVLVDNRAILNVKNLMANDSAYKLVNNVYIFEEFAKVNSLNAIVNNTKEDQEYNYNVYHLAGHSQSLMYNNAICNSSSFITLNTDGIIKKDAIETDLNQKSKGILLDTESNIIANPILEIDEYDCKASHGAGVGAIDENDLFYLMSRGIQREDAVRLIINSYMEPVLHSIEDEAVLNYIQKIVNEKI